MSRSTRRLFILASLAGVVALASGARPANADLSRKVITAFKGKILLTIGPLESQGDDKTTIAHFKKMTLASIKGEQNGNDVQEWTFNYTAFLKSGGATSLKLEFYNDTGGYAADQRLTGVDPKMTVLEGDITINEDDGLTKGKKYIVKLTGEVKGKDTVFAQTSVVMN